MSLQEAQEVLHSAKLEAYFFCIFMGTLDTYVFMTLAYDEGMINGEYVFLGNDLISNPDEMPDIHRPELAKVVLFEGFITIRPTAPSGPAWIQFQEDVVETFNDSHFDGYEYTNDPDTVSTYAGLLCLYLSYVFMVIV